MTNEEARKILKGIEMVGGSLPEDGDLVEEALLMAIKALEQTRWIPVSERLPKEPGHYLVTMKHGNNSFVEQLWYDGEGYNEFMDDFWRNSFNIIAWMPLPEPYKKEGEDN